LIQIKLIKKKTLVEVAHGAGLRCSALLTDMNQCLGRSAGNALEVKEALDLLTGRAADPRLGEVTLALAAELLRLTGAADAEERVRRALASGAAAERFARMTHALGGPHDLLERSARHLPSAPVQRPVILPRAGVVGAIDARLLGLAVVALGGGRQRAGDGIDHAVGLSEVKGIGEPVALDLPFAIVHARDEAAAEAAIERLAAAVTLTEDAPAVPAGLIVASVPAPKISPEKS
jgi:thymidine phosphorylase